MLLIIKLTPLPPEKNSSKKISVIRVKCLMKSSSKFHQNLHLHYYLSLFFYIKINFPRNPFPNVLQKISDKSFMFFILKNFPKNSKIPTRNSLCLQLRKPLFASFLYLRTFLKTNSNLTLCMTRKVLKTTSNLTFCMIKATINLQNLTEGPVLYLTHNFSRLIWQH